MPIPISHPARRAFGLIELMVVIVIIGLLLSIAVPVMGRIGAKSRAVEELSCARATVSAWRLCQCPGSYAQGLLPGVRTKR